MIKKTGVDHREVIEIVPQVLTNGSIKVSDKEYLEIISPKNPRVNTQEKVRKSPNLLLSDS